MPDKDSDPNDFAVTFVQHAKGRANDDATAKLKDVVEAVNRTGKPGKVVVELTATTPGPDGRSAGAGQD